MSYIKRDYRTNLSMDALIFLDGEEVACSIIDLSTTGAKLEILPGLFFKNTTLFSKIVKVDDLVNISIPEMHAEGEVRIIRKDILSYNLHLFIAFDNLFLGLKKLPYIRKVYRSSYRSMGQIEINGKAFDFVTYNVSTKGLLIAVFERLSLSDGISLNIDLNTLNIHAKAQLIWSKKLYNHNLLGIEFTQLDNPVKGIASFEK
jgi:hypothetical protein